MFILEDLPYPANALEPVLSGDLMTVHHDKHHATYINNMNRMLGEAGRKPESLEEVVRASADAGETKLFNNAGQAWNHGFFWRCMTPAYRAPEGELAAAIDRIFGGLAGLKEKFVQEGIGHFGSGWVWLVASGPELSVISTHDADTPITRWGLTPILVCDVWEHAYYLDYRPDRKGFLERWFDGAANWSFAEAQYGEALGRRQGYRYTPPVIAEA